MTFSKEVKLELLKQNIESECSALAFLSAILKCSSEYKLQNKKLHLIVKTELEELFVLINSCLKKLYNDSANFEINDDVNFNKTRYEIEFGSDLSKTLSEDVELTSNNNTNQIFNFGINEYLFEDETCFQNFIKGAFIACGTTNISFKGKSTGYSLEFVFENEILARDFSSLLAEKEFFPKMIMRNNFYVVYLKEFDSICDIITYMGAKNCALKLYEENALRNLRNNVNRQNNCISANISKTVNASVEQMNAIENISNILGLENLPQNLYDTCLLRLANPEESLENLVNLSDKKITKSGLNYRFNKIIEISKNLQ